VAAGPDLNVSLGSPAQLTGTATDDGLPLSPGTLGVTWSKVSGPGSVVFANPNLAATTATFSDSGSYLLRLAASDGALAAQDDVSVIVTGDTLAAWKANYFSPAELADPAVGGDDADPDLDRHTNSQEFVAGTHPRDASSVLMAVAVSRGGDGVKIRFNAVAGKTYSLQSRSLVGAGTWTKVKDATAQDTALVEISDSAAGLDGSRYYRIVTPQQP
jgi:hypothetical protein